MANSNPLQNVHSAGQSIWLDFIQRSLLDGELQALIENDSIMGLTSNPSIFENAIANTNEYDESLAKLTAKAPNTSNLELFNELAIDDIQAAADAFAPTYTATDGADGMVSLEVAPTLANDSAGTVKMALDLHARVGRPNLMIKVPGTVAGISAFEELTALGVNVNVTLLFSVSRYKEIAQAYIKGLEKRLAGGDDINKVASVASFFVSRVDTEVDKQLVALGSEAAMALKGKIAIANAKVAYGHFANLFGSEQFSTLRKNGARAQRLLWASTGTKDPDYSDVMYIEELIGPDTVNTVPPKTMDAFRDHGTASATLTQGLPEAHKQLSALNDLGISLDAITKDLEIAGIKSFADAFDRLLASIETKKQRLAG